MSFFEELKRRNVIRVGFAYLVASWLAIQVAETLFPVYGLSDEAIRLVVTVFAIGFIPTLILAWVYERTSEGIKRQKDIDLDQSISQDTGRKLDRMIIVVLALALGYFAVDKFMLRQPAPVPGPEVAAERSQALEDWENRPVAPDRKAIAVLPFANMSGDPTNEPFTLGIHDDLLTHLSRIGALKTTSRTSVLQYRDTTKSVPEIGAELNVNYILEGGVQRAGDRVRINLQLIEVATDEHLWAEIYDRELTAENLFSVQADIATEVARSMEATLLPEEATALAEAPTESMAAYDLYLLGRHHQQTRTEEALTRSVDYFEQAIAEDPEYVLAYAGLAQALILLVDYGNATGAEAMPAAREHIDRAMSLDPDRSEVWATEGLYYLNANDNPKAIEALERAIELDIQNYQAWLWYANSLLNARRYPEHLDALQVAYSLEPLSQPVNNNLAGAYDQRGDFVKSRRHWERVDQIDDLNPTEYRERVADAYRREGNLERAVVGAREILAMDASNSDAMRMLTISYVEMGDTAEARRWADIHEKVDGFDIPQFWIIADQGDFEGLQLYLEDKRDMLQAEGDQYIFELFMAAYFGEQLESAEAYLGQYLGFRGGRMEVSPAGSWQWNNLLVASFLIQHGKDTPGGPERGMEMAREAKSALLSFVEAGFNHPFTWLGLAMAHALTNEPGAAIQAISRAIDAGFTSRLRLELLPMFDTLRSEPEFQAQVQRVDARLAEQREQLATVQLASYTPPERQDRIALSREALERVTGYYTDGNFLFRLFLDDSGELMGKPGPQRAFPLVPYAENAFYVERASSISVEVVYDDAGEKTHLLVNESGSVNRLKVTEPPPPTVTLSADQWGPMTGTWAAQRIQGASGGTAETDIWTAVVSVDQDGQPWIDFDDQPPLQIAAVDEGSFIIEGFVQAFRLDVGESGDRLVMNQDGIELVFDRQ